MWTIEAASVPGLYDVYDEEGNRVVRHTTQDRARLIAAVPDLLAALGALVADIDTCETEEDFIIMATGSAIQQARAALAGAGGE